MADPLTSTTILRTRTRIRIGDVLISEGLISADQLKQALDRQKASGKKLGQSLVELGFVAEDKLLDVLARYLNVELVNLNQYAYQPEVARRLPEAYARRYRAVLLRDDGKDHPLVGMADPSDLNAFDQITQALKRKFYPALVREQDLLQVLNLIYRRRDEISNIASSMGQELAEGDYDLRRIQEMDDVGGDAPVAKLLQSMFLDAIQINASDVHIEPEDALLRLRSRVDGVLQEQVLNDKRIAAPLIARLKLMSGLDIAEKRLPQDGRFNLKMAGKAVSVRVSTLPVANGEAVVMRLLDQSASLKTMDQLGMPPAVAARFQKIIRRPNGMVLVTGPTGSGKTTTLYAALNEINTPDHKMITVEDPIEYRLPRITQVQINYKIGLDFARVLRSTLRQDPDVVMVGEMRDKETVEIGIRAAMTGHLVFSTLHTNSALATVNRLMDMGAEGYMVATALHAVVAQQLVRRVCDSCGEPDPLDPHLRVWLRQHIGAQADQQSFRRGRGCLRCHETGYRGRVGLYELLILTEPMAEALRRDDLNAFTAAALTAPDYRPLLNVGLDYAVQGLTTVDEVIRVTGELESVQETLAGLPEPPP